MYCYGNELAAIFESEFVQNFFHRIVFDLAYFVTFSQIFFSPWNHWKVNKVCSKGSNPLIGLI